VPKDREPQTLTLEECKELLEAAPLRGQRGRKKAGKAPVAASAAVKKEVKKKTKKKAGKKAKKKKKAASKKVDDS
jgi:DNA topoisomerase-1